DSLTGFDLLWRLEADLAVTLPIEGLLDKSVSLIASQLVASIESAVEQSRVKPRLKRLARPMAAPFTPAQRQIWFLQQLYPESCAYNEYLVIGLRGRVELKPLQRAINEIIRRHEILRSVFRLVEDTPQQFVQVAQAIDLAVIYFESGRELGENL